MVLVYGFTFLLSHNLSADELGQYFIIATVVNLLGASAVLGLDMGVVRFVAIHASKNEFWLARKSLRTALVIGIPAGLIFSLGLIAAAPTVSSMLLEGSESGVNLLRILAVAVPFLVAARLFNCTTQGMHQMRYQVYSRDIGEHAVKTGLSGVAIVLGAGLVGVIYASLASVVFAALISMVFAYMVLPRGGNAINTARATGENRPQAAAEQGPRQAPSPARTLIWYSLPLAFANVLVAIWLQTDKLLLGYLGTTANVAFYGVALSLAIYSSKVITSFGVVFSPIISALWSQKQKEELDALFKTVTRWTFTLTLPIFLVLVIFSKGIMGVFRPEFSADAAALVLLALGQLFNAATGACGLMVIMSGRSQLELLNVVVTLVIDVALCFLLIPTYGIMGAAIANMVGLIVVNFMRTVEVWVFMRIQAYDRSYIKPLIATGVAAAIMVVAARYVITASGMKNLVILSAVLLLLYFAVIWALGLDDRDKALLAKLKGSLVRAA